MTDTTIYVHGPFNLTGFCRSMTDSVLMMVAGAIPAFLLLLLLAMLDLYTLPSFALYMGGGAAFAGVWFKRGAQHLRHNIHTFLVATGYGFFVLAMTLLTAGVHAYFFTAFMALGVGLYAIYGARNYRGNAALWPLATGVVLPLLASMAFMAAASS